MKKAIVWAVMVVGMFTIIPGSVRALAVSELTVDEASPAPFAGEVIPTPKEEYQLPYPGLLPDNPLYFLKTLRDIIFERLLVDPVRKADFYVLQADKRLSTGLALIEKGNWRMAQDVISKGEKYMDKAVTLVQTTKASGRDVPLGLVDKMRRSIEKHSQVLEGLTAQASGQTQASLQGSLDLVKKLEAQLGNLP